MTKGLKLFVAVLTFAALCWSTNAVAQNAVGIGGRTSVTANFSLTTTEPDDSDVSNIVALNLLGAYTTESARFEYGAGLGVLAFSSDGADLSAVSLVGEARVNSDAMGPEENVILYIGGVAGVSFIDFDGANDEVGIFGPKFGAEFYITPNLAIQVEDTFVGDTEGGVTNRLAFGIKFIFE